ncbi:UDP-N-acetylmuramoyl-L-alanine--D-glutamate ligase [Gorillibacterium timonense]|uniref:UDP-N-acetylmuramoyl-L-alanine--D-glutamate ligase n=1 Tax=Gorillibacterium timonense TaxID=1689269 RepID=UPI00071E564F|nr:UDP-N-acetylmuramoyl-L-alanine--D-glutamate ligase [Gorillibacterium timonense]
MRHPRDYKDKEVVIIGLARSGVAVAKLLHGFGAKVTVNDKKTLEECPEAEELTSLGVSVLCGGHPEGIIHRGVELVVKNPGIPYSADPIRQALELGIEVVTEVEVAYQICPAPLIGITGSNGKTTTTTWIHRMLDKAGMSPILAGNIGRSLCDACSEATDDNYMVVELSSFQLKGTSSFRPHIALLLNVYETHLDYHGSMEDYAGSKAKLFANQGPDDFAILNWDDAYCRSLIPWIKAQIVPFSMTEELPHGLFLSRKEEREWIAWRSLDGTETFLLPSAEVGVPGRHNIQNALAATAAALCAGAPVAAVIAALREFRGVEHRLEHVRDLNGISYVNGSKATNPAATIKDLEAFEAEVILIAGGLDRGMEYDDLAPYFHDKVKGLVALGETKSKLLRVAKEAGVPEFRSVETSDPREAMAEAVRFAAEIAVAGQVVLLSPACASWDMYRSFEERGSMFKESVHTL